MTPDPTDEIRTIRDRLATECDYDVDWIVDEARRHQAESKRTYINLPSRPVESLWLPPDQQLDRNTRAIASEVVNCESPHDER